MANELTITVESKALLAALDRIPDTVRRHLKLAAKVTADNIADEAAGRFLRRSGSMIDGLMVEETRNGDGYVVFVRREGWAGVPGAFEWGTEFMTKRPFLMVSARLEESPHDARAREAVQAAIDEEGLGL